MTDFMRASDPHPQPTWTELEALCVDALRAAGASENLAKTFAASVVEAEQRHRPTVGVSHLFDAIEALGTGRLKADPEPRIGAPRPAVIAAGADDGPAQYVYDLVREDLHRAAREAGVAFLGVSDCFAWGELSYITVDAAEQGLVAIAGTNSPALMSVFGAPGAVTGTNPISYALPGAGRPRLIDQATSETAWVNIRSAADRGETIPEGWGVDAAGNPTTDPVAALAGAVLPFGGVKGANIALMVEMLGAMAGGTYSIDAENEGPNPPRVGAWMVVVDPSAFGEDFVQRTEAHFERLRPLIGHDFGRRREPLAEPSLPDELLVRLVEAAGGQRSREVR
ncbi:Ldh family oxidoreductase [Leucobacter sp. GX24907]